MARVLKDSFKNTLPTDRKTKEKISKKANTKCTAEKISGAFCMQQEYSGAQVCPYGFI